MYRSTIPSLHMSVHPVVLVYWILWSCSRTRTLSQLTLWLSHTFHFVPVCVHCFTKGVWSGSVEAILHPSVVWGCLDHLYLCPLSDQSHDRLTFPLQVSLSSDKWCSAADGAVSAFYSLISKSHPAISRKTHCVCVVQTHLLFCFVCFP